MSVLVVMAHFDAQRKLRKHVLDAIVNYSSVATEVVVVSTSGLDEAGLAQLPGKVNFVERRNYGYDFYSYKWGLDCLDNWPDADKLLLVNDSFIGPLVPLDQILDAPQMMGCDFMGMTLSVSRATHAQSFFVVASGPVCRSNGFRRFWDDMEPVSDRMRVISEYEIGMSQAVARSGFKLGSYFVPTAKEQLLARERYHWHTWHRYDQKHPDKVIAELHHFALDAKPWNPAVVWADRVLDNLRLPVVKIDTLRYDPYALGADQLLSACEDTWPTRFSGVREFLQETATSYPTRPGEVNKPVTEEELRVAGVGYGLDLYPVRDQEGKTL